MHRMAGLTSEAEYCSNISRGRTEGRRRVLYKKGPLEEDVKRHFYAPTGGHR